MSYTVLPGWISLALFLIWLMNHGTVIMVGWRRLNALPFGKWEGPDEKDFMMKMFMTIVDDINDKWWIKVIRTISIYGSISFFFLWLHYATL